MATKEVAEAARAAPATTLGEDLAAHVVDGMEADIRLILRRRELEGARVRIQRINADLQRMIEDLNAHYSEAEAGLARMYVQGTREELIQCYLKVSPSMDTPPGRKLVEETVDGVLNRVLAQIQPPEARDKTKRPTRGHAEP